MSKRELKYCTTRPQSSFLQNLNHVHLSLLSTLMKLLCIPLYQTINLADCSSNHNMEDKHQAAANTGSDSSHVMRISTNGRAGSDNQGREETQCQPAKYLFIIRTVRKGEIRGHRRRHLRPEIMKNIS